MLPYKEGKKLEDLLGSLFADDEDIVVLGDPRPSVLSTDCCKYSYGTYDPSGAPPFFG